MSPELPTSPGGPMPMRVRLTSVCLPQGSSFLYSFAFSTSTKITSQVNNILCYFSLKFKRPWRSITTALYNVFIFLMFPSSLPLPLISYCSTGPHVVFSVPKQKPLNVNPFNLRFLGLIKCFPIAYSITLILFKKERYL